VALATVAQVKEKLGIPLGDSERDGEIGAVLSSAEVLVLSRLHRRLDAGPVVESLTGVRALELLRTKYIPVASLSCETRDVGSTIWRPLQSDLLDGERGVFTVRAAEWPWPPAVDGGPLLLPRLEIIYPVVRVTYTVVPLSAVPPAVSDATAALAAYWYTQHRAGSVVRSSVGAGVSEEYSTVAVPEYIAATLATFEPEGARAGWAV